jgi:adenylate cyclase
VEIDQIKRFDVQGEGKLVRSSIREVDDLGRSVSTMRAVVQTFSSFVPKRLVQQLVESGIALRLGGSRREVSILFTDIAGFTNISEHADPEKLMLYTSRYLAALTEVIMTYNGTVDKFVGDAVMAIWNAPTEDPDHLEHACSAALACRAASHSLVQEFEREGWPAYRTRFGLHTGEAIVGNVGSSDRMSYTVLGATVNLAARLEALNKDYGTEILVSEAVRERVADRFVFSLVDTVRPKGFEAAVRVYELAT